ncbi:MAG: glycosyltransferase family 4 protein [Deltaproteobacteria bacterium]|nr:glycosyltransferase family 4 protein [Deltaproteobacteria bacterium]
MAKIAILDTVFTWPPDGGARTDLMEVASRLASDHEVVMFVVDFNWLFPRGRITGALPFAVRKIPFRLSEFTGSGITAKFKRELDRFKPDHVFIGDSWYFKPYLMDAAKEFPTYVRFYAYESLCLRGGGTLFRNNQICPRNYLVRSKAARITCGFCALFRSSRAHFHEILAARVFTDDYVDRFIAGLTRARNIIVYNEFAKTRLAGYNPRIKIIPSGVDAARFTPLPPPADKRGINVLMVGRAMDRNKGFHILHRASRNLWDQGVEFNLLGTSARPIRLDKVINAGWMPQEKLPFLYAQSDICVVPSLWPEPFGIVALEAMACGKPVIVSKVGGLQDIVSDGVDGYVVEPGMVAPLQQKLLALLADPLLRQSLGQAGRQKVLNKFTWDAIYENHYAALFS